MLCLHLSNLAECCCNCREPFFLSDVCSLGVQHGVLFVFTIGSGSQIFHRGANNPGRVHGSNLYHPTFEEFEERFGMLTLLLCSLKEDGSNLLIALFLCHTCKEGISITCLRFSGKRGKQVFLCASSFNRLFHSLVFLFVRFILISLCKSRY